jgi:hypothetical protein
MIISSRLGLSSITSISNSTIISSINSRGSEVYCVKKANPARTAGAGIINIPESPQTYVGENAFKLKKYILTFLQTHSTKFSSDELAHVQKYPAMIVEILNLNPADLNESHVTILKEAQEELESLKRKVAKVQRAEKKKIN